MGKSNMAAVSVKKESKMAVNVKFSELLYAHL